MMMERIELRNAKYHEQSDHEFTTKTRGWHK